MWFYPVPRATFFPGLILSLGTLLFIAQPLSALSFLHWFSSNTPFYIGLPLIALASIVWLWKQHPSCDFLLFRYILWFFLPPVLLLFTGLMLSTHFHFVVPLTVGFYSILIFFYVSARYLQKRIGEENLEPTPLISPPTWPQRETFSSGLAVIFLTLLFFSFGMHNLAQYAAVDEPLWLDGRIGKYWKNLSENRLDKTLVSDKPGITLVWATTPALFTITPKDYRETRFEFQAKKPDLNIEDYFFAFRFPLLLVITLLLPLCYVFLVRLVDRWPALIGYAAIVLSPILIGMSKIVNPDSLLWLFTLCSFLTYLLFLEKKLYRFLILSGIFLGLALLTKYVANFLIVYFFGFLFLHSLWQQKLSPLTLRHMLLSFLIWIGIALSVLYLAVPAFWVHPSWLLTSTIFSQAFEKIAWLFLGLIGIVLLDQTLFKNWATVRLITGLERIHKHLHKIIIGIFLVCFSVVLINGLFGMPFIHFVELLASPKSSFQISTLVPIFFTHFYPLLFGSAPLILLGVLIMLARTWLTPIDNHTSTERLTLAILLFILLFYLGSTVNHVVLINRYQIMLYPLLALLGGIGLYQGAELLSKHWKKATAFVKNMSSVFVISVFLLISPLTTPFPLSYSSLLLPKDFTTDVKDMGAGSYEAATYLNSLPHPEKTAIWTDKNGVCKFYVGPCYDGLDFRKASELQIQYLVLSSGRASRTSRFYEREEVMEYNSVLRIDDYYHRNDPFHEILINSRPGQSIKIFSLVP